MTKIRKWPLDLKFMKHAFGGFQIFVLNDCVNHTINVIRVHTL